MARRVLPLLLVVGPIAELLVLIELGRVVGALELFTYLVLAAALGAAIARAEGVRILSRWRAATLGGHVPEGGTLEEVLKVGAGVLLFLPGALSDVAGLALLLPPVRRWVASRIRHRLELRARGARVEVRGGPPPEAFRRGPRKEDVVDAEIVDEPPKR